MLIIEVRNQNILFIRRSINSCAPRYLFSFNGLKMEDNYHERTTIMADRVNNMDYSKIPIKAINVPYKKELFQTHAGISRDWQGLCELAGFDFDLVQFLKSNLDPVSTMLEHLTLQQFTMANLINMLELMEKFDVIEDIRPLLEKNATDYIKKAETYGLNLNTTKINKFEKSTKKARFSKIPVNTVFQNSVTYDAYVSYSAMDGDFVAELVEKMEKKYHLRLFIKDRDMLPGVQETEEDLRLINERCRRILIILSEESLTDSYCEFQAAIALTKAVECSLYARKLIPIICKPCVLPKRFKHLAILDYTRKDHFGTFWDRLYRSIKEECYKHQT